MRKLSKLTRQTLENEERMSKCCLSYLGDCNGRIEWHHNLIYQGRQSDIPNTILGVCHSHHEIANKKEIKEQLDWIMLGQMTEADLEKVPKWTGKHRKGYLNGKYGKK